MKKPLLLTFFMLCLFAFNAEAQNYKSAAGLRLGSPLSASYKTFLNESNAIEAFASFRSFSGYSWFALNGAYQIHKPISSVDGLNYYYGAGAGVYFWSFDFIDSSETTTIGIQGYLGLDYTFEDTPINLTVDWIPTYFLSGFSSGFGGGFGSLGIRYTFSR